MKLRGRKTPTNQKGPIIMKTVDVVKMSKGWYVTRRWSGMNKGAQFFPFGGTKKEQKANEAAKEKFIKEWIGE